MTRLIRVPNLSVTRFAIGFLVLFCASLAIASAQTKTGVTTQTAPRVPASKANVDETFEINISERHYSQESFSAATSVSTNPDDNRLKLQVGVSLMTGKIDLVLRNIHGTVRFRGSLDRVLQLLNVSTSSQSESSQPVPE